MKAGRQGDEKMDKFLFEITSYYQGQTQTDRTFAPDKETAIKQVTQGWVKGVEILKVAQRTFTPDKTGTPKRCIDCIFYPSVCGYGPDYKAKE